MVLLIQERAATFSSHLIFTPIILPSQGRAHYISAGHRELWDSLYSRTFEALCATIVITCVVRLMCDFCCAISASKAGAFLKGFALCTDSLDDHGIVADVVDSATGKQRRLESVF